MKAMKLCLYPVLLTSMLFSAAGLAEASEQTTVQAPSVGAAETNQAKNETTVKEFTELISSNRNITEFSAKISNDGTFYSNLQSQVVFKTPLAYVTHMSFNGGEVIVQKGNGQPIVHTISKSEGSVFDLGGGDGMFNFGETKLNLNLKNKLGLNGDNMTYTVRANVDYTHYISGWDQMTNGKQTVTKQVVQFSFGDDKSQLEVVPN